VIEIEHFLKGSEHRYNRLKEKKKPIHSIPRIYKKEAAGVKRENTGSYTPHSSAFFTRTESNQVGNQDFHLSFKNQ
jgi:hypothetical protein